MTKIMLAIAMLVASAAHAESPYPKPTNDGRETLRRSGTCPSGYVGLGNKCEALHQDTPRAYPKIKGAPCPAGTFSSGDYCKEFR